MEILYFTNENSIFLLAISGQSLFSGHLPRVYIFPKKLVTQSVFNSSDSVNNIQAGIYKGIASHELRIMLHSLASSASTEQMNTLKIALKK